MLLPWLTRSDGHSMFAQALPFCTNSLEAGVTRARTFRLRTLRYGDKSLRAQQSAEGLSVLHY